MQLKTILNSVQKFKSFVCTTVRRIEHAGETALEVDIEPRSNSRAVRSGCEQPLPGYDKLPARRFEFVPLWGMKVFRVCAAAGGLLELRRAGGTAANGKAKLTSRKAFSFRTYHAAEIALYHTLGALPEPEFTHRFC